MLELDKRSAEELKGELKGFIEGAKTGAARGEVAKMLRELACMGHEPLIEAAQGLLQDKELGLHIELESGLKRLCSGRKLERGASEQEYMRLEEEHLLSQLWELMRGLAMDRPLKELSELARFRESLWSGAIMSWLERVEAALPQDKLKRERGLLLECSDQLGHLLEYDPYRFADEGIDIFAERLQRMEHGGGELSVILPGESDEEGWAALRLSGLLSDLRGVERLTVDGFGALEALQSEGVQGLEAIKELDLKVLRAEELLSLEGRPLLDQLYAGVQGRAERGELSEELKAQLEGKSEALCFVARRCCESVVSVIKGVAVEQRYCPAGEFWMGSEERGDYIDNELPRHRVKISKPLLVGQTQVTQALYEAVMGTNPSRFKGANLPVEQVSWFDSVRFCNKLSELKGFRPAYSVGSGVKPVVSLDFNANGYRLLTEAEWEYAAKAGTELIYAGSNEVDEVAWYEVTTNDEGTRDVATKTPNAWGLYDMSGNVWEWCSDQWDVDTYKSRLEVSIDPCNYSLSFAGRVFRGGSWRSVASSPAWRVYRGGGWLNGAGFCRVACRGRLGASHRRRRLGLRLLMWNLDT